MLPSIVSKEVTEGLKSFIKIGFETNTPYFEGMFSRFVEDPGNLYKGPFLSVALPFKKGTIDRDFFATLETEHPPHVHQQDAWQRLSSDRDAASTIVATGTGSGKTECFLYPILDHCSRSDASGIKAIVIYPMNALATDQAKRFAQAVSSNEGLKGKVSVGLFVGESEEKPSRRMTEDWVITDKDVLRQSPPDILLTNYKMLDLLLLRPRDRQLWCENTPETLRYLVVDELHTFDGAQGTDLACLLRRLKARLGSLGASEPICVGTSATLGSSDEISELTSYAAQIFRSDFNVDSVIGETRQDIGTFLAGEPILYNVAPTAEWAEILDPSAYRSSAEFLVAQYQLLFPDTEPPRFGEPAWCSELGQMLKQHQLFYNLLQLLRKQPVAVPELVGEFARALPRGEIRHHAEAILASLCALIARARDPAVPQLPLVNFREQLWVRELRRMVAPIDGGTDESGNSLPVSLTFADDVKTVDGGIFLPLVQCNHCNASAWVAIKKASESKITNDLRMVYNAFFGRHPDLIIMLPLTGAEPPRFEGSERHLCVHCGNLQADEGACAACGSEGSRHVFIPNTKRQRQIKGVPQLVSEHFCPVCENKNSLMVFGARAASLTSVAIHNGYATPYNDDKKLIAFSDSVQDAAHRAGFFAARTWQHNVRIAITQALLGGDRRLTEFYDYFPQFWRDLELNESAFDDDVRFVCEFIAPNMLWFNDYTSLTETGNIPDESTLVVDVVKRLQWEVLAEFGYRSGVGRTLSHTGTAAIGIETEKPFACAKKLLDPLREQLGIEHLAVEELERFVIGFLLYLVTRGAIHHPFLESYVGIGGRNFILSRGQNYLPNFGPHATSPVFLTDADRHDNFDCLTPKKGTSWYQEWLKKTLGADRLLSEGIERDLFPIVLEELVIQGVLKPAFSQGNNYWGLNPEILYLSADVAWLATDRHAEIVVPRQMASAVEGMTSLALTDSSEYQAVPDRRHWLTRLYREGQIHRVISAEHTGLLGRDVRERTEREFIAGDKPWYPNLLSATPTLEMGIDIGDLSSVLLCSVPPTQASYLQRIGRAGRRDGNAFNMTVAAGAPHDLFFYTDPLEMMAGRVDPPGVFLNASTVISRQLTAYCFDQWVLTGIDASAIPRRLKAVLDNIQSAELQRFPYNFTAFVKEHAPELLAGFLVLFEGELTERSHEYLQQFIDDLENYLINQLFYLVKERESLKKRTDGLKRHIDKLKKQPQDEATALEIDAVTIERQGLQAVLREINSKQVLNFFTDEGLLPNYAFPEEGVTLRSVIFRKKIDPQDDESAFENVVYEYERAASSAISELAPSNKFYAGGRRVSIQQIDMRVSELETWRFCPRCSFGAREEAQIAEACPRCASVMWSDTNQRITMLKLRQVMANTSDRDSRIGDDTDDREPLFYTRQLLTDFEKEAVQEAYQIKNDQLPFGFEFIRKIAFREINFGEYGGDGDEISIAGEELVRPGFMLCKHCGMVQDRRTKKQEHSYSCNAKEKEDEENLVDCLYMYREFSSEALRILLPVAAVEGADQYLHSFIAALQLGLKKKFGGQVEHLRVMSYAEPIGNTEAKRRYLAVYDSVPGGTGYLHELMRTPEQLFEVFQIARDVMAACQCNQDPHMDGCYHCLYAYRNSYGMESTSRDTAVKLLSEILELADQVESIETIDDISVNPILDSVLEERFVEAIRRFNLEGLDVQIQPQVVNGKPGYYLRVGKREYSVEPQVPLGPGDGVAVTSIPDFLIRSARSADDFLPIAVFMDGYKYHKDIVTEDSAKRMAIVQSGRHIQWSLTWQDVNNQFAKSATSSRNPFAEQQNPAMGSVKSGLLDQMDLSSMRAIPNLGPLAQLMQYLDRPSRDDWAALVFVHSLGWFDQSRMQDVDFAEQAAGEFSQFTPTKLQQLLDDAPDQRSYGGLATEDAEDPLSIHGVVPNQAIVDRAPEMALFNIVLQSEYDGDEDRFKAAWQGFLGAYNLLQFLPNVGYVTTEGLQSAVYEGISWHAEDIGDSAGIDSGAGDLDALLSEAADEVREGLQALSEAGFALPSVVHELQDDDGEIVAEAELYWEQSKLVGLMPYQEESATVYAENDWQTVMLADDGEWVDRVKNLLGAD